MFNISEVLHQIEKDVEQRRHDHDCELISIIKRGEEATDNYLEERKSNGRRNQKW